MENIKLRDHQLVLYEMLEVIDEMCKKHSIQYMLFAGTLLGAVRHQGFIPWDDDLDIIMLRPEYERFMEVAEQELDTEKYYLQQEFSEHWPMFFSKLRKNNTACMERYIPKDPLMHQGIYIDIFPCDNLSDHRVTRKMQYFASKIVIAKSLEQRGYLTDSLTKKTFMRLCRIFPYKVVWKFTVQCRNQNSAWVHSFFGASSKYKKSIYPREWLTEVQNVSFENKSFPISVHYNELLTKMYGDYMTPLPEEQRGCKVHAEIVDTERSYEMYLEEQRKIRISEYTRSIR